MLVGTKTSAMATRVIESTRASTYAYHYESEQHLIRVNHDTFSLRL